MLFLHISDIHFRAPQCLDPDSDRDRPVRTRMMRHLFAQIAEMGRVHAILVGGDIAFQADPREYIEARKWLLELAAGCGCSKNQIMVVPGNHDVDRGAIRRAMSTRNAQSMVANSRPERREATLEAQLAHADTGGALFFAHEAYNDFAKAMNCQVYPGRLAWKQDLDLGHGVKLRVHGLTSTLLSGQNGEDDTRGALYLSPLQTTLDPAPDVVNMTICHHPTDWLSDGDDVEDKLNSRATFQLFGHKHRQRVLHDTDYVRWGAGAVNPSRSERQYEPGYNLIRIEVVGKSADRNLLVETRQFTYQSNPEGFHPIRTSTGDEVFQHLIRFPVDLLPVFVAAPANEVEGIVVTEVAAAAAVVTDAEASMGDERTRSIINRFWDLDASDRREIALELGLITEEDIGLPDAQRYGKALIRASELGLIGPLTDRVAERERRG